MKSMRRHPFTLMEVMIAALVLTLSVVATMSIVGTSRSKLLREERRWAKEHYLLNVMEYYLATGPGASVPEVLLPAGWNASCTLVDVEDGLPDAAYDSIQGWRLCEFQVSLFNDKGDLVAEQSVRKILKEEDVGYVSMGAR